MFTFCEFNYNWDAWGWHNPPLLSENSNLSGTEDLVDLRPFCKLELVHYSPVKKIEPSLHSGLIVVVREMLENSDTCTEGFLETVSIHSHSSMLKWNEKGN